MKAHVVTLLVIDFDELGAHEVSNTITNQRYPNRCINPSVINSETYDIGEWDDNHPLNQRSTDPMLWIYFNGSKERQ